MTREEAIKWLEILVDCYHDVRGQMGLDPVVVSANSILAALSAPGDMAANWHRSFAALRAEVLKHGFLVAHDDYGHVSLVPPAPPASAPVPCAYCGEDCRVPHRCKHGAMCPPASAPMDPEKRARLEREGWKVGDAAEFLGASAPEPKKEP